MVSLAQQVAEEDGGGGRGPSLGTRGGRGGSAAIYRAPRTHTAPTADFAAMPRFLSD
jgi:hypothetical protein